MDQCPLLMMRQRTSSAVEEQATPELGAGSGVEEAGGDTTDTLAYSSGDDEDVAGRLGVETYFEAFLKPEGSMLYWFWVGLNASEKPKRVGGGCGRVQFHSSHIHARNFRFGWLDLRGDGRSDRVLSRIDKDRICLSPYDRQWERSQGSEEDIARQFLARLFTQAWNCHLPKLLTWGVGLMDSSEVFPMSPFVNKATVVSAFMDCHTMPQLLKLLLEFNPNFPEDLIKCQPLLYAICRMLLMINTLQDYPLLQMMQECRPDLGAPIDEGNNGCMLENLSSQWKLYAHVSGLSSPWPKSSDLLQTIQLEVLMEPTVVSRCSLTLKILNLKFFNGIAHDTSSILSRFFLSRVALSVTPVVHPQHFMFTKLGLDSANPARDKLFGTTLGTSATIPLGNCAPTVGFTATQTISLTSKSMTDWKHEQTHGTEDCHSSQSSTFSWTLKYLGGIPFDQEHPSYPRSFKRSRLQLPFNDDGSEAFTDQGYPDTITWKLALELEGKMVAWRISLEVYVTILNKSRSRSQGTTLKFCFARLLQHNLSLH